MVSSSRTSSFTASGWSRGTITTSSCLATGINSISGSLSSLEQNPRSYFFSFNPFRISDVKTLSQYRLKSIFLVGFSSRNPRMILGRKSIPSVRRNTTSMQPSPLPASFRLFTEESRRFSTSSTSFRKTFPYLVRVTFLPFFSNSFTPSSSSRVEIA